MTIKSMDLCFYIFQIRVGQGEFFNKTENWNIEVENFASRKRYVRSTQEDMPLTISKKRFISASRFHVEKAMSFRFDYIIHYWILVDGKQAVA